MNVLSKIATIVYEIMCTSNYLSITMQKSTSVKTLSKTNDIGFHVAQKQSNKEYS